MKITNNAKVVFEYSRFDSSRTGKFYATCSFEEATPNLIFVYDIEPIQFTKPDWIPQLLMVSIKNRKPNSEIGKDQALNVIDVFANNKNQCDCEALLFDLKRQDLRKTLINVTPINLLLQC
jgi:hypothetical protein